MTRNTKSALLATAAVMALSLVAGCGQKSDSGARAEAETVVASVDAAQTRSGGDSKAASAGDMMKNPASAIRSNSFWWPEQLDLSPLRQNEAHSNPLGDDFDYARRSPSWIWRPSRRILRR